MRKRWLAKAGNLPIASIGPVADLTYDVVQLGNDPSLITDLLGGSHPFAQVLRDAKRPMIILGQGALTRPDGAAVMVSAWNLASDIGALSAEWNGFNVLHTAASRVGALDIGFLPGPAGSDLASMVSGAVDVLWLLGADEFETSRISGSTFVVYQGSHGDAGAARADVVLPGAAYTEKDGTYVSTEGRVQRGYRAIMPPGEAREDWRIIRAFSATIDHTLPYDDIEALRARMERANPIFARLGIARNEDTEILSPSDSLAGRMTAEPFREAVGDYYRNNAISRASGTMAECSRIAPSALVSRPLALAAE
jgi:NADH-quinone oxidoreductase subunit G